MTEFKKAEPERFCSGSAFLNLEVQLNAGFSPENHYLPK
jgi:hypothetical protein